MQDAEDGPMWSQSQAEDAATEVIQSLQQGLADFLDDRLSRALAAGRGRRRLAALTAVRSLASAYDDYDDEFLTSNFLDAEIDRSTPYGQTVNAPSYTEVTEPFARLPETPERVERSNKSSSSHLPTCPICWEAMPPPKRIFQCSNGHLVCEVCID